MYFWRTLPGSSLVELTNNDVLSQLNTANWVQWSKHQAAQRCHHGFAEQDGLVRTNRNRDGKSWWGLGKEQRTIPLLTSAPATLALIPKTLDVELRTTSEGVDFRV